MTKSGNIIGRMTTADHRGRKPQDDYCKTAGFPVYLTALRVFGATGCMLSAVFVNNDPNDDETHYGSDHDGYQDGEQDPDPLRWGPRRFPGSGMRVVAGVLLREVGAFAVSFRWCRGWLCHESTFDW